MIIKNRIEIATNETRKRVLDIIEAGIRVVLPGNLIAAKVKYDEICKKLTITGDEYHIGNGRIFIIGGGKASGLMAEAMERVIGAENITAGVVVSKHIDAETKKIRILEAGHPFPDQRGISAVRQILDLKNHFSIDQHDLIICLTSGGASSLMPYPVNDVTLEEKCGMTALLLHCGATIHEINIVRKHLSKIKGGKLSRFFSPAKVVSLIISDVVGNDLSTIASGLTSPDPSTFTDAFEILHRYHLLLIVPVSIVEYLQKGCRGEAEETPKMLTNSQNYILGDNRLALNAMVGKAQELGLSSRIITSEQEGDTTTIAQSRAIEILHAQEYDSDIILVGGETTLKVPPESGNGGRNQHYAAVTLRSMIKYPGEWLVASVGTDGSDFLPDVAGAIVDADTLSFVKSGGIDIESFISKYDTYNMFQKIGRSLIVTGGTGTNVGDIVIYVPS